MSDAENKKWVQLLSCSDTGSPGNVYWLGGDLSSMPIYNEDGYIAGIILGMLNPGATAKTQSTINPYTQYTMPNGTQFWGVQAYFRYNHYNKFIAQLINLILIIIIITEIQIQSVLQDKQRMAMLVIDYGLIMVMDQVIIIKHH